MSRSGGLTAILAADVAGIDMRTSTQMFAREVTSELIRAIGS
jgi:hypothetical protein